MTISSKNNNVSSPWKYLSFALIGILAAGSTASFFPQASAHITTNVQHMLEHIYTFVDGIEAKTNNLPADPASNTVVNNAMFSKVVGAKLIANFDTVCNSDKDFIVNVAVSGRVNPTDGALQNEIIIYRMLDSSPSGPAESLGSYINLNGWETLTVGATGNQQIIIKSIVTGSAASLEGLITMQTTQGAIASCVTS